MNPVIPPRPDVSYVGATRPPPGEHNTAPSRGHADRRRDAPPPLPPREPLNREWDAKEEMLLRELEEAKVRATQMEKTMRWWSDCTANWREKWSKVRNERNKAREEARQLRVKLEIAVKDCNALKHDRHRLKAECELLKKSTPDTSITDKDKYSVASSAGSQRSGSDHEANLAADNALLDRDHNLLPSDQIQSEHNFVDKLLAKKEQSISSSKKDQKEKDHDSSSTHSDKSDGHRGGKSKKKDQTSPPIDDTLTHQKISMLQMKLDEAQKTIQGERDTKSELMQTIESVQNELSGMKLRCEEMEQAKADTEDQLRRIQSQHQEELKRVTQDLEDESISRSTMDKRLTDLRTELERLQAENASEWGRRERLETEKLGLERENKKLKTEVENLQEEVDRKSRHSSAVLDSDIKALQTDLSDRTKELADLKHSHIKVKKLLQEKTTECEHAQRRAEQYELEVKKLRGRIDDLKRDLANAEDEVDQQANQVRRLQRNNDELQEQVENLRTQVDHLQTRLRRTGQPSLLSRSSSHKSFPSPHDSADDASDEDDDEDDDITNAGKEKQTNKPEENTNNTSEKTSKEETV